MKSKLRILLVEDSPDDARLAARELQRADCEVSYQRVETEPALRQALRRERWDAVLCDYSMPRFSGRAALHIVREMEADLPFIYVSGTIGEDTAVEALKSGASDYVLKNHLNRLPAAVEREIHESVLRRNARLLEAGREHLIEELRMALFGVERLGGRLQICSSCKRIRNERNEWQRIEDFILEHTEVRFIRGLCPQCMARLDDYPGYTDKLND